MKTLITDRARYEINFAWATAADVLLLQFADSRPLPEIAAEFDGLEHIVYENGESEKTYIWEGFNQLDMIQRLVTETVQLRLRKGATV